ncbi:LAME_0F07316g1_1 [Lachancea meyersii CBS 8951]|uniref:LAME_0F07316g1_1 n=1 Tax=Lachancea meyersii CBS 8951 TaxID=1266667 RepID=A0A1G4JTY5_9SACH|nr:LAME_0F07316g1_1 [Lachancea meyersii CBS 8951]
MELIQGFIQPPKVQSVDDTIPTLCDRVENATLLSDRRSAVLGLKSFSRNYREAVIASGLKPLITTLKKDVADEDSVKAILETLLILFIRGEGNADLTRNWISQQSRLKNGKYPSPLVMKQERLDHESVDQFSLWIADFMTQTDEMVHLFVGLLEVENFHIRLYTIQLLEAFVASRASRTREAIVSLPIGVSTLVALLEDVHEPVRDEAVLLLMALANKSSHIQNLVAFENIFEKLFNIIQEEGGLRGSLVVSDCLSLIVNILKYNASNQVLFMETGNLPQMAKLLNGPMEDGFHWNDQRLLNMKTGLEILMLSVESHNTSTPKHQKMLLNSHLLMIVLRLALLPTIPNSVRPFALLAAADMVRDNNEVQLELRKIDVPPFDPSSSHPLVNSTRLVGVTDLVMNWCFFANSVHTFEIRRASSELLKAYLNNNKNLKLTFVKEQINIYREGDHLDEESDEEGYKAGIFNVLLDYDPELKLNPYKLYFAVDLLLYLLRGESNLEIRDTIRGIKCKGYDTVDETEEAMSPVQTVLELLMTSFSLEDSRVSISYLCLLIYWLFDDSAAVSTFLSDKAVLQSLLAYTSQMKEDDVTVNCLVCALLGVAYEFSSPNSNVTRAEYFELLIKSVGVNNYMSKIRQLQESSLFADSINSDDFFEVLDTDTTGLPKVYFSPYFKELVKDNFYRIQTALKRGPEHQTVGKISFESFDDLRQEKAVLENKVSDLEKVSNEQFKELQTSYKEAKERFIKVEEQNKQYESELKEKSETLATSKGRQDELDQILTSLKDEQKNLVQEHEKKKAQLSKLETELTNKVSTIEKLERDLKSATAGKKVAEDGINKMNRELFTLSKDYERLKTDSSKARSELEISLKNSKSELKRLEAKKDSFENEVSLISLKLEKVNNDKNKIDAENVSLQKERSDLKSRLENQDLLVSKLSTKLRELAETCKQLDEEKTSKSAEIQQIVQTNERELSNFEKEIRSLQDRLNSVENEKKNLTQEIDSLCASKKDRDTQYQALKEQHVGLRAKLRTFEGTLMEMKALCSHFRNSLSGIPERSKSLSQHIRKLHEQHTKKLEEAAKMVEHHKNEAKSMESGKIKAAEQIKELNKTTSQLQEKIEHIASEKNEAIATLKKVKTDFEEREETTLKTIRDQKETMMRAVQEKEANLKNSKNLESEILRLEKKLKELEVSREVLSKKSEASKSKAAEELSTLNSNFAQLSEEYDMRKREHEQCINSLEATKVDYYSVKEELENTRLGLQEQKSVVVNGELRSKELEDELKAARKGLDTKNTEVKTLKADVQEWKDKCAASESRIGELTSSFEKDKNSLTDDILRLKNTMREKKAELEEERALLTEGSANVAENYLKKISTLESKLEKLEEAHAMDMGDCEKEKNSLTSLLREAESLASDRANELEHANKRLLKAIESQKSCAENLKKLKDSQQVKSEATASQINELKSVISQKDSDIGTLESKLSTKESAVEILEEKIANYFKELDQEKDSVKSLKSSEDDLKKALQQVKEAADATNGKLKAQLVDCEKSSDSLKSGTEKLKVDSRAKSERIETLEADLRNLKKELEETKSQNIKKLEKLEVANSELAEQVGFEQRGKQAAVNELKFANDNNQAVLDKLKLCESDLKSKSNDDASEKLVISLTSEVDKLKREVDDWKTKASDRSELDDLMLLVSELDEKNSKYRAKLELMGGHVSSDEDEEVEESAAEDN